MSHHRNNTLSWTLSFSLKKILLNSGDISYYVRLPRTQKDYLHGDRVRARITKKGDGSQLAEVEILALERRTEETLLARIVQKGGKRYLSILRELGSYETPRVSIPPEAQDTDIFLVRFTREGKLIIMNKFSDTGAFDHEERILFFLAGTRMEFSKHVEAEAQRFQEEKETTLKYATSKRRDFRQDFVFTIDGADAKDLDDAISIQLDKQWDFILSVHIADVAEYIREYSQLDKEALMRATSTYTPGKVVPMLPEALSNDVCSLHPGEPKLVLSCTMTVDRHGIVKKTELAEGIIESAHRGVYEEIQKNYEWVDTTLCHSDEGGIWSNVANTDPSCLGMTKKGTNQNDGKSQTLSSALNLAYTLYDILSKRRKKEGKILFESSETVFEFASKTPSSESSSGKLIPSNVKNRSRVAAHMLIEEFMVLANEEVAKWCDSHGLPFLSRVHGIPPFNSVDVIRKIIGKNRTLPLLGGAGGGTSPSLLLRPNSPHKNGGLETYKGRNKHNRKDKNTTLEPKEIRDFLDTLSEDDTYKYSRLLLPKMAKAVYADSKHRHFGLALEYYAHFTSPIRRYPDLQVHRIIKEKLRGTLTDERIIHYKKILKKVARACSERERAAEDIERAFDSLYACRYMSNHVGEVFAWRISGMTEFAYFIELESGIEVTVYLPRERRYIVDAIHGTLSTMHGKRVVDIGERLQVQIVGVMEDERRIIGEVA